MPLNDFSNIMDRPVPAGGQFLTATPRSSNDPPPPPKVEYMDTAENRKALYGEEPAPVSTPELEQAKDAEIAPEKQAKKFADLAKLERKIQKQKAEAEELLNRANAIKGAFEEADLVEALQKLGLDPSQVYDKMTQFALNKLNNTPKDPVQAKLEQQDKQLKEYKEAQDKDRLERQTEKEQAQHQLNISSKVAPVLEANPDNYECLIATYGSKENAAIEVYKAMVEEFQRSNTVVAPQDAADALEAHWQNQLLSGIEAAAKLKKFKNRFANSEQDTEELLAKYGNKPTSLSATDAFSQALADKLSTDIGSSDSRTPSKTLTNNMSPTSFDPPRSVVSGKGNITIEERMAKLKRELGIRD
jgi:hypothetical protein